MLFVSVLPFLIVLAAVALAVPTTMTAGVVAFLLALYIDWRLTQSIG